MGYKRKDLLGRGSRKQNQNFEKKIENGECFPCDEIFSLNQLFKQKLLNVLMLL